MSGREDCPPVKSCKAPEVSAACSLCITCGDLELSELLSFHRNTVVTAGVPALPVKD